MAKIISRYNFLLLLFPDPKHFDFNQFSYSCGGVKNFRSDPLR